VNYEIRGKVAILILDESKKLNGPTTGIHSGIIEDCGAPTASILTSIA